jgi:tetraprenyl-beta-curcumene synthase
VAYEIMADFLDSFSEGEAKLGRGAGVAIAAALTDAVDPAAALSAQYRPARDDGGYLPALVRECRESCASLPCYERVRPLLIRAARLTDVLALNHEPMPRVRDAALMRWAARELPGEHELLWFEASAAASGWLTVLALLALAAEARCEASQVSATYAAYLPWASLVGTMLDSYVDSTEDARNDDHSYIAHYQSRAVAVQRTRWAITRATRATRDLAGGERHAVIVACMVAMYSSKDSACAPEMRAGTRSLVLAGGSLTKLMLPVLRLWRTLYALRAA